MNHCYRLLAKFGNMKMNLCIFVASFGFKSKYLKQNEMKGLRLPLVSAILLPLAGWSLCPRISLTRGISSPVKMESKLWPVAQWLEHCPVDRGSKV